MRSMGYTCTDGHWSKGSDPVSRFNWRDLAKWALELLIIAAIAFALAFLFVEALEKEEFPQQAKKAKRFEDLNYQVRKLPTWGADGPAYSPGNEYYRAQAERRGR